MNLTLGVKGYHIDTHTYIYSGVMVLYNSDTLSI